MLTIVDGAQRILAAERRKRTLFKEEEKKPWIYAYYALMAGTQKRQARLEKEEAKRAVDQANPAT